MSQPTAPQRGERVRIVLETTFASDASAANGCLYVTDDDQKTYGLPSSDVVSVEVIAPPKPPEPQGLGAVVEDAEGNRWVRASVYVTSHRNDWHREAGTSTGTDRRHYDGIPAVRVLSEGVTA